MAFLAFALTFSFFYCHFFTLLSNASNINKRLLKLILSVGKAAAVTQKNLSKREWRQSWYQLGSRDALIGLNLEGLRTPLQLIFYRDKTVDRKCLDRVIAATKEFLQELKIDNLFKVVDRDINEVTEEPSFTSKHIYLKDVNPAEYIKKIAPYLPKTNWGVTQPELYSNLLLPKGRQSSLDFIHKIAKHELTELLGLKEHHDERVIIRPYGEEECMDITSDEYPESTDCLMYWRCPSPTLCKRCYDSLFYYWGGVEGS